MAVSFPLMMLGLAILMFVRVGWVGVMAIASVILMVFLSSQVSRFSSGLMDKINNHKDRRVRKTS